MKQSMRNRILSFVMALLLFLSDVPFAAFPVVTNAKENGNASQSQPELKYDYDTLKVTRDGKTISGLELLRHEKIQLSATGIPADAKYQWQVEHPEKKGVWVNIYDGTDKDISVTLALVENVLRPDGTAKLRCRAYTDTYAYLSNAVTVSLVEEGGAIAPEAWGESGSFVKLAEDELEFVTVEIRYVKWEYVEHVDDKGVKTYVLEKTGSAYGSYVATVRKGTAENPSSFSVSVPNPIVVGYTAGLIEKDGATMTNDTIHINLSNVTEDVVFEVEYRPALVNYSIHYYFQNIYDDLYVENTTMAPALTLQGYTGDMPKSDATHAKFDGFTSLFYEPDIIAADGSTVFNVYYERNYYLMEFDCAGGYGTDTIYVRYGTYIAVADPVRAGYVFGGWDLTSTDNTADTETLGDGQYNVLPKTLPAYNSGYKALWIEAETSYTMAYWILDGYGNKTYIGSRPVNSVEKDGVNVPIKSGDKVSGIHDLATKAEGGPAICGYVAHTHTDACYICYIDYHAHTMACFNGMTLVENKPGNGVLAIEDYENGKPETGSIYLVITATGSIWPKLYLEDSNGNGTYYTVNGYGEDTAATRDQVNEIVSGGILGEPTKGTYGDNNEALTVEKYRAKTNCKIEQHIHNNACRTCVAHDHTDNCYQDSEFLVPVNEITLTDEEGKTFTYKTDVNKVVLGDGSTIVNVYYQYREYTLKFYYAISQDTNNDKTDDKFIVVGGSTHYFGSLGEGANQSNDLALVQKYTASSLANEIGEVKTMPQLNALGQQRYESGKYKKGSDTVGGYTYHYIYFNARYNDDISELWPCAVFDSVQVNFTPSGKYDDWTGTTAFVSAWNGEYNVRYTRDDTVNNGNQTIKGKYEKLDENLLWNYTVGGQTVYADQTETYDGSSGTVSYLCFWENGSNKNWSIPELYRYNIWLEALNSELKKDDKGNLILGDDGLPIHVDGKPVAIRDGVYYKLEDSYDTCDNSEPKEQTQVSLTGYKAVIVNSIPNGYHKADGKGFEYRELTGTTDAELLKKAEYFNKNVYVRGFEMNFYYKANSHSLKFYNYNGWLGSGDGAGNSAEGGGVRFGTPMKIFGSYVDADGFMVSHYPDGMEPGAYKFDGWYTSALFMEDTKVVWDTMSMPDHDLTLYARWLPVKRNVYFYLTYEDVAKKDYWDTKDHLGNDVTYPIIVEHGQILGTAYNYTPVRPDDNDKDGVPDYTFIGWFYMDEDNKKRFAPDTMEIKRDMHLFAEWQSLVDTEYTVEYVLEQGGNIGSQAFPAGTVLAVETVGHSTAGRTKTFIAKAGTLLLDAFKDAPLFPLTNTHSILMDANPANNNYTFKYVLDDEVYYKIRYVNKVTGEVLDETDSIETDRSIVTVKFKNIPGYVPEQFYIQKVLAYDEDSKVAIADNIITFYYLPNTEKEALFNVEYYKFNLLTGNYEQVQSEPGRDEVGKDVSVSVDKNKFAGFDFTKAEIVKYTSETNSTTKEIGSSATTLTEKLGEYGLVFKLYYDPIEYPYLIKFVDNQDRDVTLGYGKLDSNGVYLLKDVRDASAKFDSKLTYTAPSHITVNGVNYDIVAGTSQTQTLTIRIEENPSAAKINVLTFYYTKEIIPVEYHVVCTVPGLVGGQLSQSYEPDPAHPMGCTAYTLAGFNFLGWYSDAACTQKVQEEEVLNVTDAMINKGPDGKQHYYALFAPIYTDLTINLSGMAGQDSAIFHIVGEGVDLYVSQIGNGSVTIHDIRVAVTYEITEIAGWSWEYGDVGSVTLKAVNGDNEISFTLTSSGSDWLNGETAKDNIFNS